MVNILSFYSCTFQLTLVFAIQKIIFSLMLCILKSPHSNNFILARFLIYCLNYIFKHT